MKDWEIIADNLSKAGWSWGCVAAIDSNGRTIWIADALRDDGRRFVVHITNNRTRHVFYSRMHDHTSRLLRLALSGLLISDVPATQKRAPPRN